MQASNECRSVAAGAQTRLCTYIWCRCSPTPDVGHLSAAGVREHLRGHCQVGRGVRRGATEGRLRPTQQGAVAAYAEGHRAGLAYLRWRLAELSTESRSSRRTPCRVWMASAFAYDSMSSKTRECCRLPNRPRLGANGSSRGRKAPSKMTPTVGRDRTRRYPTMVCLVCAFSNPSGYARYAAKSSDHYWPDCPTADGRTSRES